MDGLLTDDSRALISQQAVNATSTRYRGWF